MLWHVNVEARPPVPTPWRTEVLRDGRGRPPNRDGLTRIHDCYGGGGSNESLSIGLFVPVSGVAGIWGPSSIACAELAAAEINRGGGIDGRELRMVVVDASDDAEATAAEARRLIDEGAISAIVGMHISAVRQRLRRAVAGDVPYVYTPLYEGNETTPGVYAIGETPEQQLRPAIRWLSENRAVRRWAMIGNDYIWPRVSHRLARHYIEESGGMVRDDVYVPMGVDDVAPLLDRVVRADCDAVLVSLIGQDAVAFNRAFGEAGLHRRMLRLSCAIEESALLGIGADNTERLFAASAYFASLETDGNLGFKERYHARFGDRAPVLNTLGQSVYEGVNFLHALLSARGRSDRLPPHGPLRYKSARGARYRHNGAKATPVYLAQADGHRFDVLTRL